MEKLTVRQQANTLQASEIAQILPHPIPLLWWTAFWTMSPGNGPSGANA